MKQPSNKTGFTLIELSIVLVIIGLIVGGVLVGRDLIKAAEVRAQVSQIEKFQTAVNTFKGKYNALPGDMDAATAARFGFALGTSTSARGLVEGLGDGNGLIEGITNMGFSGTNAGYAIGAGEPVVFWSDLTYANGLSLNLIEGSFNASSAAGPWNCNLPCGNASPGTVDGTGFPLAFPQAKIGNGNSVYAYSDAGVNYYGISVLKTWIFHSIGSSKGITVQQAFAMDKKVDDGLPLAGTVLAKYINFSTSPVEAGTASASVAVAGASTTCYDNSNNTANPINYSIGQNSGNGVNCALSFKFQ